MSSQDSNPIAIVGMSCRFPGGANDPEKLWSMLSEGRSAWSDVPSDRFNENSFHHPCADTNGTSNHRGGHFLNGDISKFDASFFGIQPSEAHAMDPQQRIQLETAYEALENAGIPLEQIRGSNTSVYVATFSRDYDRMMFKDTSDMAKYHMTGTGDAILSNRISHTFDFKGPSMTLDTGCSGSMVALHQACQSLKTGESKMALVGGTNLILSSDQMIPMSLLHILNDNGRCYSFDSRGAGYGRGEGVATIVLKPLKDAIQARDKIRAVIRNTGINQDGMTSSIAVPNQNAQQNLIRSVYQSAGIDPKDVGYVEAHGTGTVVGDSIEASSIANVFCEDGKRSYPLFVGSIKPNIGHLESSSAIAGLIKTVLILENAKIPPNLNLQEFKPDLSFEAWNIKVPRVLEPWPTTSTEVRRASVSSFGYGGTNGHAILESAPSELQNHPINGGPNKHGATKRHFIEESVTNVSNDVNGYLNSCVDTDGYNEDLKVDPNGTEQNLVSHLSGRVVRDTAPVSVQNGSPSLFVLTANSERSLMETLKNLRRWISDHEVDEAGLKNLAYTLCSRRSMMQWRWSFVASSHKNLLLSSSQKMVCANKAATNFRVAFLFTGQGAQWFAMGRELLCTHSKFRESLLASNRILQNFGVSWNLIEELLLDESSSRIDQSEIAQPATTALQIALTDLLESLGVKPYAVLGHSSGEIAAAYAAGALSNTMALKISYHRSFISSICQKVLRSKGAMLAVGLGEKEISKYISQARRGIASIACVNSPSSTTISGDEAAIVEVSEMLETKLIFNKKLRVDTAYHSHHMRKIANEYRHALNGVESRITHRSVKFVSSVTAMEKSSGFGPSYWVDNLVSKVRFSDALEKLCCLPQESSQHIIIPPEHALIEIGPHSVLSGPFRQTITGLDLDSSKYSYFPSLVRGRDAAQCILELAGKIFERGGSIDLEAALAHDKIRRQCTVIHDLPPYPWDHLTRYWHESRLSKEYRLRDHPHHDLLGLRVVGSTLYEPSWRNILSENCLPWLCDHVVDNFTIFPGSGYLCMAIEALRQIIFDRKTQGVIARFTFRDVFFWKALIIPESPAKVEIQLSLRSSLSPGDRNPTAWEDFRVSSISEDGSWNEHCRGSIAVEFEAAVDETESLREEQLRLVSQKQLLDQVKNVCSEKIDSDSLYNECQSNGNVYGPTFAMIKELRVGDRQAVGTVVTADIAACMPSHFLQPHVIHPATLDNIFHINIPLYLRHCSRGSIMPVSINEISISAKVTSEPGKKYQVVTTLTPAGQRSATVETLAFQQKCSEMIPMIIVSGAELRGLGDLQTRASGSGIARNITYRMEWASDITSCSSIKLDLTKEARNSEKGEMPFEEKETLLIRAASLFMQSFLERLSEQALEIPEKHHAHLVEWMKNYQRSGPCQELIGGMTKSEIDLSLRQVQHAGVEGDMVNQIGKNFTEVLTGQMDPLSVMLEDNLLYRFYTDDSSSRCYSHLVNYIKRLSFKRPYLNVLEIGAGTGGTTIQMLRAHTDHQGSFFKHYDYTDISSGFFEQVQPSFQEWAGLLRMKSLDIERDPIEQGFEEASYDLIIASNVIHATSYLEKTMANVRKLLKPKGKLAMIEITCLTPPYMMIMGLLPGWWKGINDGRKEGPLLAVGQWDALLSRCSFNGVEVQADDIEGPAHRSSLMISGLKNTDDNISLPPINIIGGSTLETDSAGLARDLLLGLEGRGFQPAFIPWSSGQISKIAIYVVLDLSDTYLLADPSPEQFKRIAALFTEGTRIFWISGQQSDLPCMNPEKGLVTGFSRTARIENEALKVATFDIQEDNSSERPRLVQVISEVTLNHGLNIEFGKFFQQDRPLKLHVEKPGLLDSLMFVDDEAAQMPLQPGQLEIQVAACGINFKDVFVALGQMKPLTRMTGECAGIVTAVGSDSQGRFHVGDRVCAFDATPYASRARVNCHNVHRIPPLMPFSTAASIPVVFATAYHSLVDVARLQKGQTVLIHAASGGVGQAALKIAQHIGAEIFATVGSAAKGQLLIERYQIDEDHIFSSRKNFKNGILRLTDGNGVDVILNSVSGEALHDTWSCIGRFGTFIEIGKLDIYKKSRIRMEPFDRNVTFASVDLSLISEYRPAEIQRILGSVMTLFEAGDLTSVEPITIIPIAEIEHAFRLIQGRRHTGKIILETENEKLVKITQAKPPPLSLEKQGSYLIAGGLGNLGQHIARFLAAHGAGHIILLSRRSLAAHEQSIMARELKLLGAEVHVMPCDIADPVMVNACVARCRESLPPLKGVIQAAMILQNRLLDKMTAEDLKVTLLPKLYGTKNLHDAMKDLKLDFFVMLSSLSSIIGLRGQANYAAGNNFQDYLANSETNTDTRYVSLNLGLIGDSGVITSQPERLPALIRAGCIPLKLKQSLALLEWSLSPQARQDNGKQVIVGVDRQSICGEEDPSPLGNPIFSHFPYTSENQMELEATPQVSKNIGKLIMMADGIEDVQNIISAGIAKKIAALMALDFDKMELESPIADLGLDSLVAIELKNWIGRTLQAAIQVSEIQDMSVLGLTIAVAKRSTLVTDEKKPGFHLDNPNKMEGLASGTLTSLEAQLTTPTRLPSLPLSDLESMLQFYFAAVRTFCSKEELEEVKRAVEEFLEPGKVGRQLQNRLMQRANDSSVDGWQFDLYNDHVYLKRREPVNPFQHMGACLKTDTVAHGQAEGAAIISLAAFHFKQRLEANEIEPDYLNEHRLCMNTLQWIFNAYREPGIGVDRMRKYPGNDFMMVLRQGHVFKVTLKKEHDNEPYESLKTTFQEILDKDIQKTPSVATLTADERDSWTKFRKIVKKADQKNDDLLQLIEASAFIVCLDDASPSNPTDRLNQYILGDISNRWSDKTLQFVICKNGVSGILVEHSMVDGNSLKQLTESVSAALFEHKPEVQRNRMNGHVSSGSSIEDRAFVVTPDIESQIGRVQRQFDSLNLSAETAHFACTHFGGTFLRSHNCSPKAGYQLVIQIASRLYFGYQPPCWETVSMHHFHNGRVDILQAILPEVEEFCASALDNKIPVLMRRGLFFEAAKAHTKNLTRVSQGRGFAGHLYALQEVLREGEELPSLFTNRTYAKTRPGKIMTDCTDWHNSLLQEGGWVMPDPEHVWVHYSVGDEECRLFIKGPKGRTKVFFEAMETAAVAVKGLLEEK